MEMKDLLAAIDLHKPVMYDKYGRVTTDPEGVSPTFGTRCNECCESVPFAGCRTWRLAHGGEV